MNDETLQLQTDETSLLVLRANGLAINDADTYKTAAAIRGELKTRIDWFENFLRPDIDKANQLHKSLLAKLKQLTDAPGQMYLKIGLGLSDFDRRAEEEKLRLEREAERKRKEAEAEQARLAALAEELGSTETAEEIKEKPVDPGEVIVKDVPKVPGLTYRHGGYGFNVIDEKPVDPGKVIVKDVPKVPGLSYRHGGWTWAIENRDLIPGIYWIVDEKTVTGIVNRLGKQAEKAVPGIVVVEKPRIPVQRDSSWK